MTGQRLTDAQIATALRAHLPAHARADVRMRIAAEVESTRQQGSLPWVLAPLSDADPDARRRAMLLAAAALLALGVIAATVVGALIRRDEPPRITTDPAVDAAAFVEEAFAAHAALPAMTLVARLWDLQEGPVDIQRFYVNGEGHVRHECCNGTILILAGQASGTTFDDGSGQPVWVSGPQGAPDALPAFELAQYAGFQTPDCPSAWRYLGPDRHLDRPAHRLACPLPPSGDVVLPDLELWLDAELGIALRSTTWGTQLGEDGEPIAPYGSEMLAESITFGEPDPALFMPPPGMTTMTQAEQNCRFDPGSCETDPVAETPLPVTKPETSLPPGDPPDIAALVAAAHATYAGLPALEMVIEERGLLMGETRRYTDGRWMREEWHFDPGDPASPTVYLRIAAGMFESWFIDGAIEWRRMADAAPLHRSLLNLDLPETCETGWEFLGLDVLLGAEAWHIGCDDTEYWIDRERLLVVRSVVRPDALHTRGEVRTVTHVELRPQPAELFVLPDDAVIIDGGG